MSDEPKTKPNVFMIESLKFDDERNNRFEGDVIKKILRLGGIESEYYYIRTKKEFKRIVGIFNDSNYRYLHISCHGSTASLSTTLDEISYEELGEILKGSLYNKRLFLSVCSAGNKQLAECIIPKTKCYSIIGPSKNIEFRDAAIMWASFYHLMFKMKDDGMNRENIKKNLQKVVNTFEQPLNYYSKSESKGIKNRTFIPEV